MSWIYLVLAGLCEIGWPLGFKLSQTPGTGPGKFAACIACSVFSMVLSGFLLWLAQRNTPIGTAIQAVTPAEIAVSIAGEMILCRAERRGDKPHGCPML